MTYTITNDDIDSAYKALKAEQNGREPYAGSVHARARLIAEERYRSEKATEPYLPAIVLASERITAQDLGPIVVEDDNGA